MNTEENTQEPVEDTTYAQISEAINNLILLADGYGKRILAGVIVEDEEGDISSARVRNSVNVTCDGKDSSQIRWVAATGHMLRAEEAISGDADAICEGIRYAFVRKNS